MPIDYDKYVVLGQQSTAPSQGSYLDQADPKELLRDPRFLHDLRTYYAKQGQTFDNDEDLVNEWYDDRTFAELNLSFGTSGDVLDNYGLSKEDAEQKKRLIAAYQQTPFFWQEGGMGERDPIRVVKSIGKAVLLDPVNWIGFGAGAVAKTGQAVRTAAAAGKGNLGQMAAGAKAGMVPGLVAEAAVSAPIEAGADAALQYRDMQLGLRDEFDLGQTAKAAGIGAAAGGALGSVFGAAGGAAFGRGRALDLQKQHRLAQHEADPSNPDPNQFATVDDITDIHVEDLAENERVLRAEDQRIRDELDAIDAEEGVAETAAPAEKPTGLDEEIDIEAVHANLRSAQIVMQNVDRNDEEAFSAAAEELAEAEQMAHLAERIITARAEIDEPLSSNDPAALRAATRKSAELQQVIGLYKRLVNSTDDEEIKQLTSQIEEQLRLPPPPEAAPDAPQGQAADVQKTEAEADVEAATPPGGKTVKPLTAVRIPRVLKVDGEEGVIDGVEDASKLFEGISTRFEKLHMLRVCLSGG